MNNKQLDINFKLINLHHSDRSSLAVRLNIDDTLEIIRQILQEKSLMTERDFFINNVDVQVERDSENGIKLNEVLKNENKLDIGNPVRLNNLNGVMVQYFDEMSFDQKCILLSEKYCNIYNGLTIKDGHFKLTDRKLYKFDETYVPTALNPSPNIESEELLTFSEDTFSLQCNGVISESIPLTKPWRTAHATYEYVKIYSPADKIRSYYTKRFLYYKVHLSTDIDKLIVDEDFVQAIKNAVSGRERSINGYQHLVEVLNTYGWYIPIQYTLGGAIYSTKMSEVYTFEEAETEKRIFSAEVEASYSFIKGGTKFENNTTNDSSKKNCQKSDGVTFKQLGGDRFSENNFSEWETSLKEPKNWNIIRYNSFLPSLMLLRGKENGTLSDSLKLLTKYNSYAEVKSLQNDINVQEYENKIAYELNPITGE